MVWLAVAIAVLASGIALVLLAHAPRWGSTTRPPTDDEAARLAGAREAIGVDVHDAAVVRTTSEAAVDVRFVGLPGARELLVTEPALEQFDDASTRALLAAAAARARSGIDVVQALAAGVAVGLLAAVYVTPLSFAAGLISMWLFALAAFAACRRLHYVADARAAEQVGADELADAVEREATLRGEGDDTGSWRTWMEVEPSLGARVERLRSIAVADAR